MLDVKLIREKPEFAEKKLKEKDPEISLASFLKIDKRYLEIKKQREELKSKQNSLSKEIGEKKRKGEDAAPLMEEVASLKRQVEKLEHEFKEVEKQHLWELSLLPNIMADDVKVSQDPAENVCLKTYGEKRKFSFRPKNHVELNEKLGLFDFERGAKMSGSGWPVYKGLGAALEWALLNYMIDVHRKNNYVQYMLPLLVREEMMFGSAQLPKFRDQSFRLDDEDYPLFLIPTSEVSLNALHFDEILEEEKLPLKYFSFTPCFRREAGAAGTSERGLIRVHQFNKVEMYCFCTPEQSAAIQEEMVASAEEILQGLNLHYRNMLLVSGDASFAAAKTIDIEVYLPGQERYYEVSSISNCTDFQARRSKIRSKKKEEKPRYIHTLNGSGLATSRLMVALLENNQQEDGSVEIPTALHKYLEKPISVINPE